MFVIFRYADLRCYLKRILNFEIISDVPIFIRIFSDCLFLKFSDTVFFYFTSTLSSCLLSYIN